MRRERLVDLLLRGRFRFRAVPWPAPWSVGTSVRFRDLPGLQASDRAWLIPDVDLVDDGVAEGLVAVDDGRRFTLYSGRRWAAASAAGRASSRPATAPAL